MVVVKIVVGSGENSGGGGGDVSDVRIFIVILVVDDNL